MEYLEAKIKKDQKVEREETECSGLSLSFAMRNMEEEYSPYSLNDLKERFT